MDKKQIKMIMWFLAIIIIMIAIANPYIPYANFIECILGEVFLGILYFNIETIFSISKDNTKTKFLKHLIISLGIVFILICWLMQTNIIENKSLFGYGLMGVLLIWLGNVFPKIPRNIYIGIRLPWTCENEATWRFTHRLSGYLGMLTGFIVLGLIFVNQSDMYIKEAMISYVLICAASSLIYYLMKGRNKVC